MKLHEAIRELTDQRSALNLHLSRGGEYVRKQLEATDIALDCMKKVQKAECIRTRCYSCGNARDGRVCPYYADKVDEIRRIHEGE